MSTQQSTLAAKDIYKILFTGERVTLRCESAKDFETLRVSLCKQHQTPQLLDMVEGSLCARYEDATGLGIFWIGERKRKAARKFEIVSVGELATEEQKETSNDTSLRNDLESDQGSRRSELGDRQIL